jgi:peptidoglycan/xylan/chitin deacetylase (PgdA/CDA1 family)
MVEIRGRPEGEVQRVVAELTAALGEPAVGPNAADLMMGWDEVRTMAASGLVAFGAHTVTHRNLTRVSPDELRWELAASRAAIERATSRPVRLFAYPYGRWGADYNDAVREAVAAAGYDAAFTVDSAMAELGDDPFAIPRISECADRWRGPGGAFSAALFDAYLTGVRGEYEALPPGIRGAGHVATPPAVRSVRHRTAGGAADAPAPRGPVGSG